MSVKSQKSKRGLIDFYQGSEGLWGKYEFVTSSLETQLVSLAIVLGIFCSAGENPSCDGRCVAGSNMIRR